MDARTDGRRGRAPEALGPILSNVLSQSGVTRPLAMRRLAAAWRAAVGDDVAGHTRIVAYRRNVLEVEVDSPARLHELANFQKPTILMRLAAALESGHVRDIRFRQGAFG